MRLIRSTLLVLGYLVAVNASESGCAQADGDDKKPEKKHKPRFTIGKDTHQRHHRAGLPARRPRPDESLERGRPHGAEVDPSGDREMQHESG
jgi:hypothetical protein